MRGHYSTVIRVGTTNPTVSRFLDRHAVGPCLRCKEAIGDGEAWAMLAQVRSDRDVLGGRFCTSCVKSFRRWLGSP